MKTLENFLSSKIDPQIRTGFFEELKEKTIVEFNKNDHFFSVLNFKRIFTASLITSIIVFVVVINPISTDLINNYHIHDLEKEIASTELEFQNEMNELSFEEQVIFDELINK